MIPINDLVREFTEFGPTEYQTSVYRELISLLDSKHPSVLGLFESGDIILFEGYEYRISRTAYSALSDVLRERGF